MQTVLEQGSIDKPLTFDVGLIQLSFIPVCSLNTCNISVKLCRGFALQCFSFEMQEYVQCMITIIYSTSYIYIYIHVRLKLTSTQVQVFKADISTVMEYSRQ